MKAIFTAMLLLSASAALAAGEATFYRAVNLGGPALRIDGQSWEAGAEAPDFKASGTVFENQKVPLQPPTDNARSRMIRSSVYGGRVQVEFAKVPAGPLQVVLYVWEDNNSEQFDVLVNDRVVLAKFQSGTAGKWKMLGPWPAEAKAGRLTIAARGPDHSAANFSGVEIWTGNGPLPGVQTSAFAANPTPDQIAFFESRVRPLFAEQCYECHSGKAKNLKANLLLDSRAGVQKGGDTGAVVTPGDPAASLLIEAVKHGNPNLTMPPDGKLKAEEIAVLEEWIRMGAPDPRTEDTVAMVRARSSIDWAKAREWWAFRPLTSPAPPAVKDTTWPANDLDRFTLAKMEAAGLSPAKDAEKLTLLRRVTYDLTGLPPTPAEADAFLADAAPNAFTRVVDRLLASSRYGERWGRHWLDVVRYADTAGDNSDFPIPQMRRYRDWVIDAFNRDLPYDQFVREQLAGDLLASATEEERQARIVATGYIANARRFGSRVDDYPQHLTIEDTLDNLGRTFLGLTINCARCHDHKFDPIPAADYYALYGIFSSTRYPWPGIELDKQQRDLVPLVPATEQASAAKRQQESEKQMARLRKDLEKLKDALKNTPEPQKAEVEAKINAAEQGLATFVSQHPPVELAYAVAERAEAGDAAIQLKGEPARPGATVRRRFLTVLGGMELPPDTPGSGRAQLADWILSKENPLPARVMANRIWLHHFGRGLVPTPNDFGKQGKPATHPELLDWLALKFRDGGWSVKSMHRLILLSRTWQLSALRSDAALQRDPANELLTGFPRRRLDAEAIRDTLLALGGNLDLSPAGDHPFPPQKDWGFTQHHPFKAVYETNRRSVYLMTQRIQRHPYLAIFDGADPSTSSPQRPATTTPLQSLYLLNDPFVHNQSKRLADRIVSECSDESERFRQLYRLTLCRLPGDDELAAGREFLVKARAKLSSGGLSPEQCEAGAWHSYVRVLFRLNEFVYPD